MIRLIAVDMDGTLLTGHTEIHPENVKAVRHAMERGVVFVVASGRMVRSCSRVLTAHELPWAHIIGANGCEIAGADGNIVEQHFMDSDTARETLRIYEEHGLHACLFSEKAVVYPTKEAMMRIAGSYAKTRPYGDDAMNEALAGNCYKTFCIMLPGQEQAFEAAKRACAELPGLENTSSWHNNFEVMPAGVNKGVALAKLAGRLGIPAAEIMAFGDSDNDISMLEFAGFGFAMGNAGEDVKARAKYLAGRNDAGGVAQGIYLHV